MKEVLMVAEKPNLATALSNILSRGNLQRMHIDKRIAKGLPLFEWEGTWPQTHEIVRYKMTSTYGHVNEIAFEPEYEDWRKDPDGLFSCATYKRECNPESRVVQQLKTAGRGADYLVLWLDCDKEGENICFEVMDIVTPVMKSFPQQQRIFRARFSALTETDVLDAFANLRSPNRNESHAVDARMELDLRIGCAFTRFQTRYFIRKYGKATLKTTTIPFGPCQTPTLAFCVERHNEIVGFRGEAYYKIDANVEIAGSGTLPLKWHKGRTFDRGEAEGIVRRLQSRRILQVVDVTAEEKRKLRPPALNTVQMLRMASSYLKISPSEVMEIAERLYMDGFISYPRTETTQYPASFDRLSSLASLRGNAELSGVIDQLMYDVPDTRRTGKDVGDHPPIIPLKCAGGRLIQHERSYSLYQMICKHFLASLSSDCVYLEKTAAFDVDGEKFFIDGIEVLRNGFTDIHQHQKIRDKLIPSVRVGSNVGVRACSLQEDVTTPPTYLTESDLIQLMEKHGIGTDASIPAHIQNIFKRNFVQLNAERRIIPSPMGLALIQGYRALDEDLVKPQMRSTIERDLSLIAKGSVQKEDVVKHVIEIYRAKYRFLIENIRILDAEISLLPLIEDCLGKNQNILLRTGNNFENHGQMVNRKPDNSMPEAARKRKLSASSVSSKKRRVDVPGHAQNPNEVPVLHPVVLPPPSPVEGSLTQRLMSLASGMKPCSARQESHNFENVGSQPSSASCLQPRVLFGARPGKPESGAVRPPQRFAQACSSRPRVPFPPPLIPKSYAGITPPIIIRCSDLEAPAALAASFARYAPPVLPRTPAAATSFVLSMPAVGVMERRVLQAPVESGMHFRTQSNLAVPEHPAIRSESVAFVPSLPEHGHPLRELANNPTHVEKSRSVSASGSSQQSHPSSVQTNARTQPSREELHVSSVRTESVTFKSPVSQLDPSPTPESAGETRSRESSMPAALPRETEDGDSRSSFGNIALQPPKQNVRREESRVSIPHDPVVSHDNHHPVFVKQEWDAEFPLSLEASRVPSFTSHSRDFSSDTYFADGSCAHLEEHRKLIKTEVIDPYWESPVKSEPLDTVWAGNSSTVPGFMKNFVAKIRTDIMTELGRPVAAVKGHSHKESISTPGPIQTTASTAGSDRPPQNSNETNHNVTPGVLKNFSVKGKTPVQALYEYCQKAKLSSPSFDVNTIESKPPVFSCTLKIGGSCYGPSDAANKKDAMRNVARMFLTTQGYQVD